jgi:hypothetical protein
LHTIITPYALLLCFADNGVYTSCMHGLAAEYSPPAPFSFSSGLASLVGGDWVGG